MSSNLYNALGQVMKGDSFMLVRGVGSANGTEAWWRNHPQLSPPTPVTVLALASHMWVMSPGRAKNHRQVLTNIEEIGRFGWAPSVGHGEELSEHVRMSHAKVLTPSHPTEGSATMTGNSWPTGSPWKTAARRTPWTSGVFRASTRKVAPRSMSERSARGRGSACGEKGHFSRECVAKGGKTGIGKGQKGRGAAAPGTGKGGPKRAGIQTWGRKGQKGANFRFMGACNVCGGWGHRRA